MSTVFLRGWLAGGLAGTGLGVLAGPFVMVWGSNAISNGDGLVAAVAAGLVYGGVAGCAVGVAVGLVAAALLAVVSVGLRTRGQATLAGAVAGPLGGGLYAAFVRPPLPTSLVFLAGCAVVGLAAGRWAVGR